MRFLNRHPVPTSKFVQQIDRQQVFANSPILIADRFKKLGKILQQESFWLYAITNVDEKGIILGYSARSKVITRRGKKTPCVK